MYHAERHDTLEQPQVFGRFNIRGVLGEGGMGRLYVAEQTGIEGFAKIVALKRILPHLADSPHFRSLFLNEARVAARLEHPNIVTTYELGEVDGTYFIAMEYLPGEDLSAIFSRCGSTPMPIDIAVALAHQSANGLHYAHELRDPSGRPSGLVHRDVNPSNIFVTYYGMVKLLDFGIVKAASDSTKTSPGVFKGKYAYSAPEQIQGDPVDQRTDVFCLGIVLWECLTGRRLFEAPSDAATIDAVRSRPLDPPSRSRSDLPPELDELTLRALMRDPAARFQTALEFSEALERFLVKRVQRSTSKGVGQWLDGLFGGERAALKKAIAQGTDVENSLSQLKDSLPPLPGERPASVRRGSVVRPRALWSTTVAGAPSPMARGAAGAVRPRTVIEGPPEPARATAAGLMSEPLRSPAPSSPLPAARKRTLIWVMAGLGSAGALAAALFFSGQGSPITLQAPVAATGALEIATDPPGAHVIVDGVPSGLTTPTTLNGLRSGRAVEIRLDKEGFAPQVRHFQVTAGVPTKHLVALQAAVGLVKIEGVPARAQVFLDDNPVQLDRPITVPVGTHKLRVEADTELLSAETIEIQPGEQTVRVRIQRRTP